MPSLTVITTADSHARPAARVAHRARALGLPLTLEWEGRSVPADSMLAIMGLGVIPAGASVTISAPEGPGARAAVEEIAGIVRGWE